MAEATCRLVGTCVGLARTVSEAYKRLAASEEDSRLRACWERLGREKEQQVTYWSRLARMAAEGIVPPLLEHSEELAGELEALARGIGTIVRNAEAPQGARERARLALSLECHLLHPAIETLVFLLRAVGCESPKHNSAEGEDALLLALAECAKGEPELELIARIARQLWLRNRELLEAAHRDAVTGLHNWPGFWTAVLPLAHLARRRGEEVAVLTLDVDGFGAINEALGHKAGDAVLRSVAGALLGTLREADVACRIGADKFVAFLAGVDATGLKAVLQRVNEALGTLAIQGRAVTVRLGTAQARLEGDVIRALEHLIYQSDENMEATRRRGQSLPSGL